MKIEIKNDLFNVVKRLKNIDKDYFVVFDSKKQKFELHHSGQGRNTYCLTFPYTQLDARAILHTLITSVKNSEKLFFEIEKNNLQIEKGVQDKIVDEADYKFRDIVSYLNKTSKSIDFNNIQNNKWI